MNTLQETKHLWREEIHADWDGSNTLWSFVRWSRFRNMHFSKFTNKQEYWLWILLHVSLAALCKTAWWKMSSGTACSAAECMRLESRGTSASSFIHFLQDCANPLPSQSSTSIPPFPLTLLNTAIQWPPGLKPPPTPHFYRATMNESQRWVGDLLCGIEAQSARAIPHT